MFNALQNPNAKKHALLVVVMFLVLAGSVAAAWWLVNYKTIDAREGAAIIRQLRKDTLSAYWDGEIKRFYIAKDAEGKLIRWEAYIRKSSEGNSDAFKINRTPKSTLRTDWFLNNKMTRGKYLCRYIIPLQMLETSINLDGKQVVVDRAIWEGGISKERIIGANYAPDNYIPEGAMPLVLRQVDNRGKKAVFQMILDNSAFDKKKKVQFARVTCIPEGKGKVLVEIRTRFGKSSSIYYLDDEEEILRQEWPLEGISLDSVELQDLIKIFPEAAELFGPEPDTDIQDTEKEEGSKARSVPGFFAGVRQPA